MAGRLAAERHKCEPLHDGKYRTTLICTIQKATCTFIVFLERLTEIVSEKKSSACCCAADEQGARLLVQDAERIISSNLTRTLQLHWSHIKVTSYRPKTDIQE